MHPLDHHAMARLARTLYESGLGPREVLRECYGVEFPEEFFVIAEAAPQLMTRFTILPWALARGGPPPTTAPLDRLDRKVIDRDPDLIPLCLCLGVDEGVLDGALGGEFLCYRRSELAAGRSTVLGVAFEAGPQDPVTARGDSLLSALHGHRVADAVWMEQERRRTAGHSGGGLFDDEDVAAARAVVAEIEDLRRRLT
ncbi:hypothetical protein GCM10029964_003590 [Kibdelosporangium lantanae]